MLALSTSIVYTYAMAIIVEIRAGEGGEDAKLLVIEQLKIYQRVAVRRGL